MTTLAQLVVVVSAVALIVMVLLDIRHQQKRRSKNPRNG